MHLFFDLDGTLTDSREGIVRCIQHALTELDIASPPADDLTRYVGPPLAASFAALLGTTDPAEIDVAMALYRERYTDLGIFENALYPGIDAALRQLTDLGYHLAVVTAKPHVYATRILDHFGVAGLFRGVYGPELADRKISKELLIRRACADRKVLAKDATMIGDRAEDVIGAKANGVGAIAVTWGYGELDELTAAAPDLIVASCDELLSHLRRAII